MKAVIFGVNSQDGFYLKQVCQSKGITVIGISRSIGDWLTGDVSDTDFVRTLIQREQPDYVFHLAANSTTRHSAIFENHATICTGTLNVLEAVRVFSPQTKVFITGSGVQFENAGQPIKATDPFDAGSAYAVARIQSVYAARYFRTLGVKAYVGYLFHHESPLRKERHMSQYIVGCIRKILKGELTTFSIGDISVRKEWGYALDIAKGIFTLVSQEDTMEAAIGTGIAYSIEDWIALCFGIAGLNWQDYYVPKNDDFKSEYNLLVSDPSDMNALGWQSEIGFSDLGKLMMQGV